MEFTNKKMSLWVSEAPTGGLRWGRGAKLLTNFQRHSLGDPSLGHCGTAFRTDAQTQTMCVPI